MQASRTKASLDLLHFGLVAIRNPACGNHIQICEIEGDPLHHTHTLIDEPNEVRHRYDILHEQSLYLERLRQLGAFEYLEGRKFWYHEFWKVFASRMGIELTESR